MSTTLSNRWPTGAALRVLVFLAMVGLAQSSQASPYVDRVLEDGPVRYYRLGDAFGDPAVDATGTGDGTYLNFSTGDFGQPGALVSDPDASVLFDGSNNVVTVPNAADLNITGDLTIEFWMVKNSEAGDWQRLLGKGESAVRTYGIWEESGSGKRLLFQQYNGSNASVLNFYSNSGLDTGQWYHVAATVEGNTGRIYINGKLDATATRSGTPGTDTEPLTLGKAAMHTYFPGRLDEVAVYDKALPGGVLRHHYHLAQGFDYNDVVRDDGAGAYYRLDDASSAPGSTAADSIGTHHGTYGGTVALVGQRWGNPVTSASFDGASGYIELPAAPFGAYPLSGSTTTYALSFETWFRTTDDGVILGQTGAGSTPGVAGSGGHVPAIYVDVDGKIRSSLFYHGSSAYQIVSPDAYDDNDWHHLVDVYDNGVESLYVDGQLVGTRSGNETGYNTGGYDYYLGTGYAQGWSNVGTLDNGWYFFRGQLDDVAVYPLALSADDVLAHYLASPIPEPTTLTLALLAVVPGTFWLRRRRRQAR